MDFVSGGIGGQIAEIVGKRVADKDLATKLEHEIRVMLATEAHGLETLVVQSATELAKGQQHINEIEAQSDSLLKSGWRPMTGWVCVSALAYQMIVRPLLAWASPTWGWMPPPSLELDTLLTLLFGILGLGAYRTAEKIKGAA